MASSIDASTSGAGGVITTADNTGILQLKTAGTTAVTVDASQNVGIGTATVASGRKLQLEASGDTIQRINSGGASSGLSVEFANNGTLRGGIGNGSGNISGGSATTFAVQAVNELVFASGGYSERMRIDSSGDVLIGNTSTPGTLTSTSTITGIGFNRVGYGAFSRDQGSGVYVNRLTNDGNLVEFSQAGALEGTISVSGTTVSYNGGHLSRWSQWQNETGQPNVYRGTVLESTNDMCEWEKDGEPLPNEQATKTIVSTTVASKAVAGVFDRYDEDDETNPYDFYVAQSGDFVIRIAQGVVVQNGDLLESAGDGTAKPQADDICRSSTVAKVTSNYVSATYEDGSYCVPCILMIG